MSRPPSLPSARPPARQPAAAPSGPASAPPSRRGPSRPAEPASARRRLLEAALEHFSEAGLGDQSLRRIAEALGTSHRMLLYHFGSKDGLLLAVAREVEARTQAHFALLGREVDGDTGELVRRMWASVSDPALAGFERLFFALYARALQGDAVARPLLDEDIESWLAANDTLAARAGVPVETARAHARLGLAVTRGLLLDLLATGDRAAVDAALEVFATTYDGRWWEPLQ